MTCFLPAPEGKSASGCYDRSGSPLEAKRLIGDLPEAAPAYPVMTVHGFLAFAGFLRGLTCEAKNRAIARVVELCFLDSVLHQGIDTLSKGYKHRTCLAQALIHDPEVLVLDEPTDGLDPNQKHEVRNLIRELGRKKAVVFSTHILEEVDAACTRAIIIDRGRVVANGTPAELRGMSALARAVTVSGQGVSADKLAALGRVEVVDGAYRVFPADKAAAGELAREVATLATREGWRLEALRTEEGQLDEVFRRITLPDTVKK